LFWVINSAQASNENYKLSESSSTKYKTKLCEISDQLTGITFQNVDKKWLHDDIYIYIAKVITKTISFNLELTITFKVHDSKMENFHKLFLIINFYSK